MKGISGNGKKTTIKKKLKKIQISGSIYHVHGLEELTSLKCPYYPKQPVDSVPFLLKHQYFTDIEPIFQKFMWNQKDHEKPQQS